MFTSLDGYAQDGHGGFGWGAPEDEELHSYINELASPFGNPTSLIPGWNPGAWANTKNWAEAIGTKTAVTNLAVAGSNAGKIVDYSLTAGTATTAASELSGVISGALIVGSKIVLPVGGVATVKDVLAHAGCAVKSVLGFIPTLVP